MHFHSVSRLMNRVSRVARRGRRQTKHGARCSSPCEQRVLLLCERLEDRLAPAVLMIYDQVGDVAIQGKGDIELTEYQLGQQNFLKVDVGQQGFDRSSSQPVPGRLMYFPTGSPDGSNFALVFDNTPNSIPTLRITGKSDASFTIPNLNSGIDTVLVEADRATFVQYDDRRGFVKVKEADINGPTTIANLTAAKTIVNSIQANFLGRNNFGDLDVNQGGGVSVNGDATAGEVTNLGSFFVYGGLTAAGLTNDGNFRVAAGGSLQVTDFINTPGATFTAQHSKVEGRKLDNSGEMLWLAAIFGFTDLKNSSIMRFDASQVIVSEFSSRSGAISINNSKVTVTDFTQRDGTLIFNRVPLTVGHELALTNVALNANESSISVGVRTTVTGGTTNIVASFINSPEYRQRFGGISIDPKSRFAVTGDVSVDDSANVYVGGNLSAREINVNRSDLIVDGTAIGNGRNDGGTVSGFGILVGNWDNNGRFIPGRTGQPGVLTINGNYTQGNAGTLCIQFGANGSAKLVVMGSAIIDGTLALKAINNFVPMLNAQYLFLDAGTIDGAFTDVDLNLPNPWQAELFKSPNGYFVKLTQPL